MTAPRLLFAPVTGQRGAGEYFRSLTIAEAALQRWPDARIHFIVDRAAGFSADVPFPVTLIDGSPTRNTPAVNALLAEFQPNVVIFDSSGREAQLRAAQRRGIRTVYISSRPNTRWKGFRIRRMRQLDQHWLAWPEALGGALTHWERLKLALMRRPRVVFLGTVFAPSDESRSERLKMSLGLAATPYLLICGGGGGYQRGQPAAEIFRAAAVEIARSTAERIVCVMGPNYRGAALTDAAVIELAGVEPHSMSDLIAGANLAIVGGGSLMLQALALHTPTLAAPVAADQDARIELCRRCGAVEQAALDAGRIAAMAMKLLQRPSQLASLRDGAMRLRLRNGAAVAIDALNTLL